MLAALVSALGSTHALAHAIVVRSDPPDGSVLSVPPREIRLWFSEAISPQLTQARLLNMNGEALPSVQVRTDSADATLSGHHSA